LAVKRDISGQKFGKLFVLNYVETINKLSRYLCQCDCGNQKVLIRKLLVRGDTKSCGCDWIQSNSKHHSWKGYEDLPLDFFTSIKRGAKSRNIEFDIKIEDIWDLLIRQDRKCALSGLDLKFSQIRKNRTLQTTCSLDRIDSSMGYVNGNVQWVHKKINIMKNKLLDKDFIYFCVMVSNKNKKRIIMENNEWKEFIHVESSLKRKKNQFAMFCGRFQPLHESHIALFKRALENKKNVLICIRDGEINEKNPFTAEEVLKKISEYYKNLIKKGKVKVMIIPDICSVEFGRGVGYDIIEHIPPTEVAEISATKIREQMRKDGTL
jgi:phosphopantetheine adenylyltransferase